MRKAQKTKLLGFTYLYLIANNVENQFVIYRRKKYSAKREYNLKPIVFILM